MMSSELEGLENIFGVYIDDIVVFSDTWEDHISCAPFDPLLRAKLTVNLAKYLFVCEEIVYLDHVFGLGKIMPMKSKVNPLLDTSRPQSKKTVTIFC